MKRFFILAFLATFLFSACSDWFGEEEKPVRYVTITVNAGIGDEAEPDSTDLSRTSMEWDETNKIGKVKWCEGDKITIRSEIGKFNNVTSGDAYNFSEDSTKASFDFKFVMGEYDTESAVIENFLLANLFFYYGQQTFTFDDTNVNRPSSIFLDASQYYAGNNGFQNGENASIGFVRGTTFKNISDFHFTMRNIFGILKLNITLDQDRDIEYIQLKDNNADKFLAGNFTIKYTSHQNAGEQMWLEPTLEYKTGSGGSSHVIEKKIPVGTTVTAGPEKVATFYFMIPPGTLSTSDGFNVLVFTRDGYYGGKKITFKDAKIERSKITYLDVNIKGKTLPPTTYQNTANCYIAPIESGKTSFFTFPAQFMGNAYQGNGALSEITIGAVKPQDTRYNLGQAGKTAEILWQTKCDGSTILTTDIVSAATFHRDNGGTGFITVELAGVEGNALVALKDENNNILWSWHLWIVDKDVKTTIDTGIELNNGTVIFDRNLGALTEDVAQGNLSFGLAYQYGRKDPFLNAAKSYSVGNLSGYNSDGADFMTTAPALAISRGPAFSSLNESIKNPNFRAMTSGNWVTSYTPMWWSDGKNLHDPCPVGWRISTAATIQSALVYSNAQKPLQGERVDVSGTEGLGFAFKVTNASTSPVFLPSAGISKELDVLSDVGKTINIWSASIANTSNQAHSLLIDVTSSEPTIELKAYDFGYTMPVRCVKSPETGGYSSTSTYSNGGIINL